MRILVLGSGAREHALSWRLALDPDVQHVICAPGNPGIGRTVDLVPVDASNPAEAFAWPSPYGADLTVVGAEAPLAAGIADYFAERGRPLFGPTRAAAQLETSKAFAKDFMARHQVPTARYRVCRSADEALNVVRARELGEAVVVKADGLAAGKGVVVAPDPDTADVGHPRGHAGPRVRRRGRAGRPRGVPGRTRGLVLRGRRWRGVPLAPHRTGSQAHPRWRSGAQHRWHGRVRPEPAGG